MRDGVLGKGSQFQDRNDMMSSANLAQVAQNFQISWNHGTKIIINSIWFIICFKLSNQHYI